MSWLSIKEIKKCMFPEINMARGGKVDILEKKIANVEEKIATT